MGAVVLGRAFPLVPCSGAARDLDTRGTCVHNSTSIQLITITEVWDMLVLSRRESERIRLGKSIVVTVVRVSGDKVRLGIEAPPDVVVLREELEPRGAQEPVAVAASS